MKRNTLSWRLASYYGPIDDWAKYEDYQMDVCSYVKAVAIGIKNVLLIMIASGVCSLFVGDFLGWAAASIAEHTWSIKPDVGAGVFMGLVGMVIGTVTFFLLKEKVIPLIVDRLHQGQPTETRHEPSAIALWFKGIKEKTCFTITIEKEKK